MVRQNENIPKVSFPQKILLGIEFDRAMTNVIHVSWNSMYHLILSRKVIILVMGYLKHG